MVHRDVHTGNLLFPFSKISDYTRISDMGLCGKVDNIDKTKIYGVMSYLYFVATRNQPFVDCAHDELLALNTCNGIRPKISEPEAPKCYINLMERCWNLNPKNKPNATEITVYTSQLLNPYTENLPKYNDDDSENLDCIITINPEQFSRND
ncbi:hypothetical protein C1645_817886 [Glomus cerebriforme]|uniref:Kinase-like domain-containing protein n=1 Tax=Glomus cerebriforme TaxID=658196 RepID=A0A397TB00_9GLOM|nr:hypothetical protein C1645_817886 [Glomus cerebriforme]